MKLRKRIAALGAAMVMAVSMMSIGAGAYTSQDSWRIRKVSYYIPGSEGGPTDQCTIYKFGGGYKTYCQSIYGSNDRYVQVKPGISSSYNITTTGESSIIYAQGGSGTTITFVFTGKSTSNYCIADGTVGYNI